METNEGTIDGGINFDGKEYTILTGDALAILKTLPDCCINCCVTSPPYFNLRDYHSEGQIGIERTPEEYIQKLVEVFREVRRVLKDDGTLWVNIGDSYCNSNGFARKPKEWRRKGRVGATANDRKLDELHSTGLKTKDLIGIPWMLAFALRADGWYLRQDIIWSKGNPLPESVSDRCTKAHEYIFLLSKKGKYYFDYEAIEEEATGYDGRRDTMLKGSPKYADADVCMGQRPQSMAARGHERWKFKSPIFFGGKKYPGSNCGASAIYSGKEWHPKYKNLGSGVQTLQGVGNEMCPVRRKRDVWTVPTKSYSGAHFATFPEKLVEPCIAAGCPVGGVVLDPFNGAATTGVVALKQGKKYVGIELNPEYVELSLRRLDGRTDQSNEYLF